ncbi:MAG: FecR domain-containing protein, partial [Bdellovibrionales bacterium]|nr:FecR domain-containing protein [Bdellovibrionales bacterium]
MALAFCWVTLPVHAFGQSSSELAGRMVSVTGKVMIRQEAGSHSKNLRPAQPGKEVFVGDVISTPSDGRVKILLQDRSILDIGPSSLFRVDQMKIASAQNRQVASTMAYGSVRAAVTKKLEGRSQFKVRTSSATMGVRGTEFVVKSDLHDLQGLKNLSQSKIEKLPEHQYSNTEVTVLQGKVEVRTSPAALLPSSTTGRAPGSAPSEGT